MYLYLNILHVYLYSVLRGHLWLEVVLEVLYGLVGQVVVAGDPAQHCRVHAPPILLRLYTVGQLQLVQAPAHGSRQEVVHVTLLYTRGILHVIHEHEEGSVKVLIIKAGREN